MLPPEIVDQLCAEVWRREARKAEERGDARSHERLSKLIRRSTARDRTPGFHHALALRYLDSRSTVETVARIYNAAKGQLKLW